MTIEEEIIIAARERADRHRIAEMELYGGDKCNYSYGRIYNSEITSFEAGAKYANENQPSPWIKFTEKFPPQQEPIIIAMKNKNKEDGIWLYDLCMFFGGDYTDNKNWENKINWEIPIYWMPKPPLPKE